ncbi:MAG: group 1 truncated hemoglobin [Deinococcota bacterium]
MPDLTPHHEPHPAKSSLYDKLGGATGVASVVTEFYAYVLADDRISHYFDGMDMDRQRAHQSAFISHVLGGPEHYSGRSMHKAHAHLDLRHADFDAVAGHLVTALEHHGAAQADIDAVLAAIASLERQIVDHKVNRTD